MSKFCNLSHKTCITLHLKSDFKHWNKPEIYINFSITIKTPHSGTSETALRLRRFPMRGPAARRIFFYYIKINDFLYEIYYFFLFTVI